jgi:cytochrome c-type biogenesis protein CcmH/NrfG
MSTLYAFQLCLLLIALGIIAIPFAKQKKLFSRYFILICLIITLLAGILYRFSANPAALKNWLTTGREHYQLLEQFNELGGVDGAINRIEEKLAANPNDAAGWVLLGKLYLGKQDMREAKSAFEKAHALQPANEEINRYSQLVNQ